MSSDLSPLFIVVNTNPPPMHRHPERFAYHRDLSLAEAEAKRLAVEHPGQEFTVFSAVSSALREEPVTVRRYESYSEPPF